MKIKFFGGAEMVTGSNHLIEVGDKKLLLDCGMFQGGKKEELMNFEKFPYNPEEIDWLLLSHAHIDHSGRIPKLIKDGFKGKIISTKATFDLCKIMLLDSASIQESDLEWENRRRERSGKPLLKPLYNRDDVENSLKYFETHYYDQYIKLDENIAVRFLDAGHILGSAMIEIFIREDQTMTKILYTGDLGVDSRVILNSPEIVEDADYLIMESTYGDRIHEPYEETGKNLVEIIEKTSKRGGSVIIPSFAIGRTQELIYHLNEYYDSEDVEYYKRIPVFIDSPLAIEATEIYEKNSELFNDAAKKRILGGDNPFQFPNLRYVKSVEESMSINKMKFPMVIIASSGMADAGRIRHHLKHHLWDHKNTILFVGYQANGSTGRKILDGFRQVKILGEEIKVNAEIRELQGLSAHADMNMLLNFVGRFKKKPKKIMLVHGERESAENLKKLIEEKFNIDTKVAKIGEVLEIKGSYENFSRDYEFNTKLKETVDESISDVEKLFNSYMQLVEKRADDGFERENYSEYTDALYDIKNRLSELIMIESK